ncbi:eukaryotic translation elongation factor 1 epsilon-1-like, partial [Saccoglossus kowalevskii]
MADVKQDVRAIAKFLGLNSVKVNVNSETKTPVLHTENSKSVEGLSSITVYLAKKCNNRKILGETAEQYAVVSQWSEYRVTQIDRCKNKEDICTVLK